MAQVVHFALLCRIFFLQANTSSPHSLFQYPPYWDVCGGGDWRVNAFKLPKCQRSGGQFVCWLVRWARFRSAGRLALHLGFAKKSDKIIQTNFYKEIFRNCCKTGAVKENSKSWNGMLGRCICMWRVYTNSSHRHCYWLQCPLMLGSLLQTWVQWGVVELSWVQGLGLLAGWPY